MSTSRFPGRINGRFTSLAGRWSVATATLLLLWVGAVAVARAEKDCPTACQNCRAKGGAWVNNFCFLPIKAELTDIIIEEVEDPVLIV